MYDDLIGRVFDVEDGELTVSGARDAVYVTCIVERPDGSTYETVRVAEQVRRRIQLEGTG